MSSMFLRLSGRRRVPGGGGAYPTLVNKFSCGNLVDICEGSSRVIQFETIVDR